MATPINPIDVYWEQPAYTVFTLLDTDGIPKSTTEVEHDGRIYKVVRSKKTRKQVDPNLEQPKHNINPNKDIPLPEGQTSIVTIELKFT